MILPRAQILSLCLSLYWQLPKPGYSHGHKMSANDHWGHMLPCSGKKWKAQLFPATKAMCNYEPTRGSIHVTRGMPTNYLRLISIISGLIILELGLGITFNTGEEQWTMSKIRVILTMEELRGRKALGSSRQSTVFSLTRNGYYKYLGPQDLILLWSLTTWVTDNDCWIQESYHAR